MNRILKGQELMLKLMIDFDDFLEKESNKLNYDKDELQELIKKLLEI